MSGFIVKPSFESSFYNPSFYGQTDGRFLTLEQANLNYAKLNNNVNFGNITAAGSINANAYQLNGSAINFNAVPSELSSSKWFIKDAPVTNDLIISSKAQETTPTSNNGLQVSTGWNNVYSGYALSATSILRGTSIGFHCRNGAGANCWGIFANNQSFTISGRDDPAHSYPNLYLHNAGSVSVRVGTLTSTSNSMEIGYGALLLRNAETSWASSEPQLLIHNSAQTGNTVKNYILYGRGSLAAGNYGSWFIDSYYSSTNPDRNSYTRWGPYQTAGSPGAGGGILMCYDGRISMGMTSFGTSTPLANLQIDGYVSTTLGACYRINSSGGSSQAGGSVPLSLYCSYSISCNYPIYAVSDIRLKENIVDMDEVEALKLLKIKPKFYEWKKKLPGVESKPESGLISQELRDAGLEELIGAVQRDDMEEDLETDSPAGVELCVKYDRLAVYLLKLVQIQQRQIETLEERLDDLIERLTSA